MANKRYLNTESCKAILDVAKTVYNEENDRLKTTETKSSIVLAFTGVLANFYLQYIFRRVTVENLTILDSIFILTNLLMIFLSGFFLLKSLTGQKFGQVKPTPFVLYTEAERPEGHVLLEMASTYNTVIEENKEILKENKMI